MDVLTKRPRKDTKEELEKIFRMQARKAYDAARMINRAVFEGLERRRPPQK